MLEHNAEFLPRIFLVKLDVVAPVNIVRVLARYYRQGIIASLTE